MMTVLAALQVHGALALETLTVQNSSSHLDGFGYLHVVGEIQNGADVSYETVQVNCNFYDTNGGAIATAKATAIVKLVGAGGTSPFDVMLFDRALSGDVSRYDLSVGGKEASMKAPYTSFRVVTDAWYRDEALRRVQVVGEVLNEGDLFVHEVRVIVTFYSSDGNVAAVSFSAVSSKTAPTSDDLGPGEAGAFQVATTDWSGNIDRYALQFEAQEYVVVPEFTLAPLDLVLVFCAFCILLFPTRKKLRKSPSGGHLISTRGRFLQDPRFRSSSPS
jgi:hypothetical protein